MKEAGKHAHSGYTGALTRQPWRDPVDEAKYPQVSPVKLINSLLVGTSCWIPAPTVRWDGQLWISLRQPELSYPADGQIATDAVAPGWWFEARAELVLRYLTRAGSHASVWDIGGGSGTMARCLMDIGSPPVVVVEPMWASAQLAIPRSTAVFASPLEDLALPPKSLPAGLLLDVIEHLANPDEILSRVAPLISDEGVVIVTVPAHKSLWSSVDEASGHYRRYSRSLLRRTLESNGLRVTTMRHAFSTLYIPALLARRLSRTNSPSEALAVDRKRLHPSPRVDLFLRRLSRLEHRLPAKLAPRFGTSLVAVARPVQ